MPLPPVTALACCLLILLFIVLTTRVSILRQAEGVSLGTGNNARLERAVRAQGNLTESAPLALMMLLLLELSGASTFVVAILAGAYTASRIAHATGILFGNRLAAFRTLGAACSLLGLLAGGGMLAHQLIDLL